MCKKNQDPQQASLPQKTPRVGGIRGKRDSVRGRGSGVGDPVERVQKKSACGLTCNFQGWHWVREEAVSTRNRMGVTITTDRFDPQKIVMKKMASNIVTCMLGMEKG